MTARGYYCARRDYLSDPRDDLKLDIAAAFADAPTKDNSALDRLSDGKDRGFVAVGRKVYPDIVEIIQSVDGMRTKRI